MYSARINWNFDQCDHETTIQIMSDSSSIQIINTGIEALLKKAELKRTPVRIGVLELLHAADQPLDVLDLLKKLPSFTEPVTVYRTLNTFVTKKIVHRVRGEDRSWRYAIGNPTNADKHQHAHFVCDSCGKVECVDDIKISSKLMEKANPAPGYVIHYPEVLLHGICAKCN